MATGGYLAYGELAPEARGRAYETWASHRRINPDQGSVDMLDGAMEGLKAAVESIWLGIADGSSASYDGGEADVTVVLGPWFPAEGIRDPDELPEAEGGGDAASAAFAAKWNSQDRPELAEEIGRDGRADPQGYRRRAQGRVEECLGPVMETLAERATGRDVFADEVDAGLALFEEDGTYVPSA